MTRPVAAVALGSNVGDRRAHLEFAVSSLRRLLSDLRVSSFIDTEPVGVAPQGRFLNAAVVGVASGSAHDLLAALLAIERERGRQRPYPGAPRSLDLDLILFGAELIDQPGLKIPHPRFRDRRFVLEPLAEIGPDLMDPVSGKTVRELLDELWGKA